jgi:hypothetical protein
MNPVLKARNTKAIAQARSRALLVTVLLGFARSGHAGQTIDGPPAPIAPEVITREAMTGRAAIRAVRLNEPLRVDGRLDEPIYSRVPALSDFVQMEPTAGSAATEKTEVWIFFDAANVYVSFRCWESHPERMGALNIESGSEGFPAAQATNFSVVRLKRDILRRSSVGVIATTRSAGDVEARRNTAYGVDGTFALSGNLTINTYWARAENGSGSTDASSYRGQLDYAGDRYGVQVERLVVGKNFDPGVGFVQRPNMRKNYGYFRFGPRPRESKRMRKLYWNGTITRIENGAGKPETRDVFGEFAIDFQNSDRVSAQVERDEEFIPRPFTIAPGITLPIARYNLANDRSPPHCWQNTDGSMAGAERP